MNEFDQYAGLNRSGKRAFHARRSGQSAKNRGLAKIGYRDPIQPAPHEGPGPMVGHSESDAIEGIREMSHMPPGGQLSPRGDIGALSQDEAAIVFPSLRKMGSRVSRASKEIPLKEKWIK